MEINLKGKGFLREIDVCLEIDILDSAAMIGADPVLLMQITPPIPIMATLFRCVISVQI
jgi:hypothetical protein